MEDLHLECSFVGTDQFSRDAYILSGGCEKCSIVCTDQFFHNDCVLTFLMMQINSLMVSVF